MFEHLKCQNEEVNSKDQNYSIILSKKVMTNSPAQQSFTWWSVIGDALRIANGPNLIYDGIEPMIFCFASFGWNEFHEPFKLLNCS